MPYSLWLARPSSDEAKLAATVELAIAKITIVTLNRRSLIEAGIPQVQKWILDISPKGMVKFLGNQPLPPSGKPDTVDCLFDYLRGHAIASGLSEIPSISKPKCYPSDRRARDRA